MLPQEPVYKLVLQINIDFLNTGLNVLANAHQIQIYMATLLVKIVWLNVMLLVVEHILMLIQLTEFVRHHAYLYINTTIDA